MSRKRYPEEFKIEAVRQAVERGHSIAEAANRLGMTTHSLYSRKLKYGPRSDDQQAKNSDETEIKQFIPAGPVPPDDINYFSCLRIDWCTPQVPKSS